MRRWTASEGRGEERSNDSKLCELIHLDLRPAPYESDLWLSPWSVVD